MIEKLADLIVRVLTGMLNVMSKKRTLKHAQNIIDIYVTLKSLVAHRSEIGKDFPVYQFAVMVAEPDVDGKKSGALQPKNPYKLSCLYSDYRSPIESFMRYKSITVDGPFMDILVNTIKEGHTPIHVNQLKQNCLLHLMLDTETIIYSEIHLLHENKGDVYLGLISTVLENETFGNTSVRMEINYTIDKVKSIIQKM